MSQPQIDPSTLSTLSQILSNLVLGDNALRTEAEQAVDQRLAENPQLWLLALGQVAQEGQGQGEVMRGFAWVLLRRLLFRAGSGSSDYGNGSVRTTLYDHLPSRTLEGLENLLISGLTSESVPSVRRKLIDATSEVCNEGFRRGRPWHQLQQVAFNLLQLQHPEGGLTTKEAKITSYLLFSKAPNLILDLDPGNIVNVFVEGLNNQDVEIRHAALLTSTTYLTSIPYDSSNASQLGACTPLVNGMLDTLPRLAENLTGTTPQPSSLEGDQTQVSLGGHVIGGRKSQKSNYAWLTEFLQALVPLTTTHPHFFQPHLETLLNFLPPLILPQVDSGPTPTLTKPFPTSPTSPTTPSVVVTQGASNSKGRLGLNTNLVITSASSGQGEKGSGGDDVDDEERSELRLAALEFMISISESRSSMVKRLQGWAPTLVRCCLEGMAELDESEDALEAWRTDDPSTSQPDTNDSPSVYEQSLDRLACALGGKTVLPGAFGLIPSLLASYDWRSRHAGLMAIAAIAEGTGRVMVGEVGKVVELITPLFKDQHPRVRWATCQCVGQLCTDLEEVLQANHHQDVLGGLIPCLEDPEPRVHAHAAAALINFCEGVEPKTLLPYLDELVKRLLALLSGSSRRYVQEQAITTLAMVADASEVAFVKHYSTIMPMLLTILQNASASDYKRLRVKAMECAGLIAIAVGREVFRPDAGPLAEALIRIQKSPQDPSDTQLQGYLVSTWGKICQALGPEFEPYLPVVMPHLLETASAKADISVYDEDAETPDREGWETISLDGQLLGIRTSAIEEKCQAFETLAIYASTLNARFAPYMGQTMEIALPSLKFYFHEGVREASALLIPMLLACGKNSSTLTPQMVQATFSQLINVLSTEADISFLGSLYRCINESLRVLGGPTALSFKDELIEASKRQLTNISERRKARSNARQSTGGERDEEQEEEHALLEEVENFALEDMGSMVGAFDTAHPLLVAISGVKELGGNRWFNEED